MGFVLTVTYKLKSESLSGAAEEAKAYLTDADVLALAIETEDE